MKTIGVIVSKGPNAKAPYVEDEKAHKKLLKSLYNAIGKPAPWEQISTENIKESEQAA